MCNLLNELLLWLIVWTLNIRAKKEDISRMQTIRYRYQLNSTFQLEVRLCGSWKSQALHVRNFFNWYLDVAEYLKARIIYRGTVLTQIVIERKNIQESKLSHRSMELSFNLRLTIPWRWRRIEIHYIISQRYCERRRVITALVHTIMSTVNLHSALFT